MHRYFIGATTKIDGVLFLRSENMTQKVNYDNFCEKLNVYMMNEFKGGENMIEDTTDTSFDVISRFETENKPVKLTRSEKDSNIEVKIKNRKVRNM